MTTRDKLLGTFFETRAALNEVISQLDSMPWVLRITCLASLCMGLVLLVMSIFQIGSFRINDETLSWEQLSVAGYYPFLVVSALAMTAAGIGVWLRRGWSRWVVVLLYVIASPIEIIYWRSHTQGVPGLPWGYGISAVVSGGFFYWYLFYKQKHAFD